MLPKKTIGPERPMAKPDREVIIKKVVPCWLSVENKFFNTFACGTSWPARLWTCLSLYSSWGTFSRWCGLLVFRMRPHQGLASLKQLEADFKQGSSLVAVVGVDDVYFYQTRKDLLLRGCNWPSAKCNAIGITLSKHRVFTHRIVCMIRKVLRFKPGSKKRSSRIKKRFL